MQVDGDLVNKRPFPLPLPSSLPVDPFKDSGVASVAASSLNGLVIDAGVKVNIETENVNIFSHIRMFLLLSAKWLSRPVHCLQSIYTKAPSLYGGCCENRKTPGGY